MTIANTAPFWALETLDKLKVKEFKLGTYHLADKQAYH